MNNLKRKHDKCEDHDQSGVAPHASPNDVASSDALPGNELNNNVQAPQGAQQADKHASKRARTAMAAEEQEEALGTSNDYQPGTASTSTASAQENLISECTDQAQLDFELLANDSLTYEEFHALLSWLPELRAGDPNYGLLDQYIATKASDSGIDFSTQDFTHSNWRP
ncbi:hypothetical protein MMC30_005393 [Trapelia coarctata]|nr:hypothetical protein [Trapelia coarctata]